MTYFAITRFKTLSKTLFRVFSREHLDAIAAFVCAVLVLLGWIALQIGWLGLGLLLLPAAYVIGGYESAKEGLTTLWQEKELDVDLLMIVAALGAAGLGVWRREYYLIVDGAVLILIFAISGALEGYAMQRTERDIRSLMSLSSDTARVVDRGQEKLVDVERLQVGDRILVKPGELIPTDGIIQEGYSTLNEAAITGESLPVEKTVGHEVFAGTLNGNGALILQVHQPPESSLIQRIIQLVKQAQTEAPPSQMFIERFERGYAKVIVLAGILLAILPPFIWGWSWETTIYRALIFLVVASPCALMAAIMPTLLSGIANGARQGILFKSGAQLEMMGKVRAIAFDKTGTLTTGKLAVTEVIPTTGHSVDEVLQIAAALEAYSEHPIGQAIVTAAQQKQIEFVPAVGVYSHPGQGIIGEVYSQQVLVGKADFLIQNSKFKIQNLELTNNSPVRAHSSAPLPTPDSSVRASLADSLTIPSGDFWSKPAPTTPELSQHLEAEGKTVIWVARESEIIGIVAVADTLRPKAVEVIKRLKQLGIEETIVLTGDNQRTADRIAQSVGIDRVHAELLPEDKVKVIRQLQSQYQTVAMVGDGINDAPALAQASVGIAMGVTGSDVALETADLVLMADRLEKLVVAIHLGRRSQRIIKQNITFALSFIVLLLIANFTGNMNMPIGVIGHEGSTVIVTLSGLRLLRNW
ncbi:MULTISPECIES: heavy metal translocating P-type ATPase [Chroococcidiopsis]|uniref:Heavy metal translocating P-type ATPase n=2 Tax=Chroococcidiopsis TaxID=54298 RepID=K9TX88_CHRTP|nr:MULTISPECIES: heavy metal translocating P-type ATPase [Chroococcidiopsis]AFY86614.1 heavy metal translocating P-type ATPase [Chroococcidiopsis thermalis PCC 7203]PSB45788.1 heavy metal translocating P-type ATPase [Cyanosarcina cf. burmensis CCALA 770]URD51492.1 heavy metal translocating P-type ATPase [Chroococcidiopsis sp. CCNUC1]